MMLAEIKAWAEDGNTQDKLKALRELIYGLSGWKHNPVDNVKWVPIDDVEANDYNPNAVARQEMKLLHTSISHDGYTQPIVTIYDAVKGKYIIVDGFHRYSVMKHYPELFELNKGCLPVVVIDKDINDRMASTIRHNRARGKHSVDGMSTVVFNMLVNGWSESEICNEIGLEAEELVRLKHLTGYSKFYKDKGFGRAWETTHQIQLRKKYQEEQESEYEGL